MNRGYENFQAIKKHAHMRFGYSTIRGIDGPAQLDDMPRYILPSFLPIS